MPKRSGPAPSGPITTVGARRLGSTVGATGGGPDVGSGNADFTDDDGATSGSPAVEHPSKVADTKIAASARIQLTLL